MIKLDRPVIVEGKYDVIKLSNIIDGIIIKTDGFGIFKNKEKQKLLRSLAKEKGIIVLTDSDGAGFVIRNFISSIVPADKITHVYIPDVFGKEKRKTEASAEGKLGVEGIKESVLLEAFEKAGVTASLTNEKRRLITPLDLFENGLSGRPNSAEKRKKLLKKLSLPEHLSSSSLIKILNTFVTFEEFEKTVKELI
ncbi:MAG: DUF4093 domain-containing protein [Clostridia bacterium]|nr:DUF4093 domain-containing protein [Clostridia bacterium]